MGFWLSHNTVKVKADCEGSLLCSQSPRRCSWLMFACVCQPNYKLTWVVNNNNNKRRRLILEQTGRGQRMKSALVTKCQTRAKCVELKQLFSYMALFVFVLFCWMYELVNITALTVKKLVSRIKISCLGLCNNIFSTFKTHFNCITAFPPQSLIIKTHKRLVSVNYTLNNLPFMWLRSVPGYNHC